MASAYLLDLKGTLTKKLALDLTRPLLLHSRNQMGLKEQILSNSENSIRSWPSS